MPSAEVIGLVRDVLAHFGHFDDDNILDVIEWLMRAVRNWNEPGPHKKNLVIASLSFLAQQAGAPESVYVFIDEYADFFIESAYRLHRSKFTRSVWRKVAGCCSGGCRPAATPDSASAGSQRVQKQARRQHRA